MLNHHPREILAAGPDAIAAALGVRVPTPHPLAAQLAAAPLSQLAFAAGATVAAQRHHESDRQVMARGMGSADFSAAIAAGAQHLVRRSFEVQAQHRTFCAVVECRNFHPEPIAAVDVGLELELVGEGGEIQLGTVTAGPTAQTAKLQTYARILGFTREAIINDESGVIAAVLTSYGAAAARTEAKFVYAALEANPSLDDGAPVFHADLGNIVTDALGETALAQALALLRRQKSASGDQADLTARHLLVSPELELGARKLNRECDLGLVITAAADLPAARWYVLANHEMYPVIATLRLSGSSSSVSVEANRRTAFDGVQVRATSDLGAVMLSRLGIVRGGA